MNRTLVSMTLMAVGILSAVGSSAQVVIDGGYLDWQDVPSMAVFSQRFNPVYFRRELDGRVENLRIEEADYWEKGGTRLTELKSVIDGEAGQVYFFLEVQSPFARETSFYLYPYADRDDDASNPFTVELVPQVQGRPGIVLLWSEGSTLPQRIGGLASGSIRMECSVALASLPEEFTKGDLSTLSLIHI